MMPKMVPGAVGYIYNYRERSPHSLSLEGRMGGGRRPLSRSLVKLKEKNHIP